VRYLAGVPPGGGTDTMARIVAQKLSETLSRQFVVDNRTGASGNIAAEIAAKAAPDGYTLLAVSAAHTIKAALYRDLPYDLVRDFDAVVPIALVPNILVVHPSLPVQSVPDLIALAKARAGGLAYMSSGNGSPEQMAAEAFKTRTAVQMIHVPYKGSGAGIVDVVAGTVPVSFATTPTALPHVRSGRLRAIAVTTLKRSSLLAELPTMVELGYAGFESSVWYGMVVPARTPRAIISRLNAEVGRITALAEVKERLRALAAEPLTATPEQFAAYIKDDIAKYVKIIRDAGIRPDQ
jgi:tripartite-type tricarboxylate transporter receptor subunit TctC